MSFLKNLFSDEDNDNLNEVVEETEDDVISSNDPAPITRVDKQPRNVVNVSTTAQLQVVLTRPERFDDASGVADHLKAKRTVVLNLEAVNKDVSRRILDFLSGVAYANNGSIKKAANCTFIITPYNVGVLGDEILEGLENNGFYY